MEENVDAVPIIVLGLAVRGAGTGGTLAGVPSDFICGVLGALFQPLLGVPAEVKGYTDIEGYGSKVTCGTTNYTVFWFTPVGLHPSRPLR